MRRVRISWDHFTEGVWEFDPDLGAWSAIELDELPISNRLRRSIRHWATEQTLAYNGTTSIPEEVRAAWKARALRLTERLRDQLGDFQVDPLPAV